ncbi:2374_t:CDS:2, partial [Racocetra fulgida]
MANYQKIKPIHPGEIIREEFMLPLHLTSEKLAQDIKLAPGEVEEVIQEKKSLNMDLICRLSIWQEELKQKQKEIRPYKELYN